MNRFGCFRKPKKIVCAECGKEFIAFRHAVACSPECARVRKNRMSRDYRQNRAKPEPKREYLRRAKREEWPGVPVKYNIRDDGTMVETRGRCFGGITSCAI